MLNQLTQLNTNGGAKRINLSIEFLSTNKTRVVLTTQVEANAQGELADLLRTPIVLTGSLTDIDTMLTNELFHLSEQVTHAQTNTTSTDSTVADTTTAPTDNNDAQLTAELIDDEDEDSL
jgi:hypothetical protein